MFLAPLYRLRAQRGSVTHQRTPRGKRGKLGKNRSCLGPLGDAVSAPPWLQEGRENASRPKHLPLSLGRKGVAFSSQVYDLGQHRSLFGPPFLHLNWGVMMQECEGMRGGGESTRGGPVGCSIWEGCPGKRGVCGGEAPPHHPGARL